jgi:hypothetical protein
MHGLEAENLDHLKARRRPGSERVDVRELNRLLAIRKWLLIGLHPMILVPAILHVLGVA